MDKQYIKDTFKCIADCDMCGLCTVFKGKDPEFAHEDYISGKREYMDVSGDLSNRIRARDGAGHPVDVRYARTGAEAKKLESSSPAGLDLSKKGHLNDVLF